MQKPLAFLAVFTLGAGCLLTLAAFTTRIMPDETDGPKYEVLEREGNIEIRLYEESAVVEATVKATSMRQASSSAFYPLFRFISGDNAPNEKIPMTAPVTSQAKGQKIPMTAPVTSTESADDEWTVAFYMPSDMKFEDVPKPENGELNVRRIPARKVAAIRFSGYMGEESADKHEQELRAYLEKKGLGFEEPRLTASYDAPGVPGNLRRNEVMFVLK